MQRSLYLDLKNKLSRLGDSKMVIWGASVKGRCFLHWLNQLGMADKLILFVDSNKDIWEKKIGGHKIKSPMELSGRDNVAVLIASNAVEEIKEELATINPSIAYVDVSPFCVASKLKEIFSIYSDEQKYVITGYQDDYTEVIEYLAEYGIKVSYSIHSEDIRSNNGNCVFIVVDKEHITIEKTLIESGYKYNQNYIVLTEIFENGYRYTKSKAEVEKFDKGTYGDKHLNEYFCPLPFTQLYYYDYRSDICSPTWNNDVNVGNPQTMTIEQIWNSEMAQKIRRSVLDGTFQYCNEEICWRLLEGKLLKKSEIVDQKWLDIIKNNKTVLSDGPEFLNVERNV